LKIASFQDDDPVSKQGFTHRFLLLISSATFYFFIGEMVDITLSIRILHVEFPHRHANISGAGSRWGRILGDASIGSGRSRDQWGITHVFCSAASPMSSNRFGQQIRIDRSVLRLCQYLFSECFIVTGCISNSKPKERQSLKH
jgi:hypothetical protein